MNFLLLIKKAEASFASAHVFNSTNGNLLLNKLILQAMPAPTQDLSQGYAPRADVHAILCMISHDVELVPALTKNAIRYYGETNLDFVDCMMVAYAEAGYRTFSFDKGINRHIAEVRRQ